MYSQNKLINPLINYINDKSINKSLNYKRGLFQFLRKLEKQSKEFPFHIYKLSNYKIKNKYFRDNKKVFCINSDCRLMIEIKSTCNNRIQIVNTRKYLKIMRINIDTMQLMNLIYVAFDNDNQIDHIKYSTDFILMGENTN